MLENMHILMICSDTKDQNLLRSAIDSNELHCKYDIANSSQFALQLIRTAKYDVLVADLSNGKDDLLDMFEKVKYIPVIVLINQKIDDKLMLKMRSEYYSLLIKDEQKNYLKLLPISIKNAVNYNRLKKEKLSLFNALRDSEARFDTILETSGIPTVVLKSNFMIKFSNSEFSVFSGFSKKDVEEQINWLDLIPLFDRERMRCYINHIRKSQLSFDPDYSTLNEFVFIDKSNNTKTILLNVGAFRNGLDTVISFSDITLLKKSQDEKEELIKELRDALNNVKKLSGLIPICANCKKIRDDKGYWTQVEDYISKHSEVDFSHSICPDCLAKSYPKIYDKMKKEDNLK